MPNLGNRQRQRDRFLTLGADAFLECELLELLLHYAAPRANVKPVAKSLLERFGGLLAVLAAEPAALRQVKGVGTMTLHLLKLVHALMGRALREEIKGKHAIQSWAQLIDYCTVMMAYEPRENFRIMFLDNKNHLIGDEVQQVGTVNQAAIYPREVIKRALEVGATSIIMVHNHPSGDPVPSRADITLTTKIQSIGKDLGISVHDHLVIGHNKFRSFKSMRIL